MTETIIEASTATNYRCRGSNSTYSTARNTCGAVAVYFKISNSYVNPLYYCDRIVFKFDTSAIPDGDAVSDVKMRLVCVTDESTTDFDVQICEYDWSASDPLGTGNMETVFDGVLAEADYFVWRNTSGMSLNTQYTGPSMTPGYVSKTGSTYYAIRVSSDYTNSTPSDLQSITLAEPGHATASYRPALIVTHAASSAIAKLSGVTWASVSKRNGIAVASISKINGVEA